MKRKPIQLDAEEQQILDDFDAGEFESVPHLDAETQSLRDDAQQSLRKDRRINIRISSRDLLQLQRRAAREGMPYQTFISSTLHKMVSGQLVDAK
jgi:predicted DNA binding CopG/RHH family protein